MLPTIRSTRGRYARVATDEQDENEAEENSSFQTVHLSSDDGEVDGLNKVRSSGNKHAGHVKACWRAWYSVPRRRKTHYTFKEDLLDFHALPAKLFYLFMSFGGGFLVPYLPVFFRKLGLSPAETGLLGSLPAFVTFWSAPMWSGIADKYQCLRLVLVLNLLSYMVFHVSLLAVPTAIIPGDCLDADNTCAGFSVTTSPSSNFSTVFLNYSTAPYHNNTLTEPPGHLSSNSSAPGASNQNGFSLRREDNTPPSHIRQEQQIKDVLEAGVLVMLAHFFSASMHSSADAAVIQLVDGSGKVAESRYGKQRLWGAAGFALGNIVSGVWANALADKCHNGRYSVHFAGFAIFMTLAALIGGLFLFRGASSDRTEQGKVKSTSANGKESLQICRGLKMIFSRLRPLTIFLAVLSLAIAKGMDFFLIWFLKEMCASEAMLGWALFMLAGSEVPMFMLSDKIVARLGHTRTIYIVFALFVARTGLYATLHNPYFVLPLEVLRGMAFSLLWSCVVQYGRRIATPGLETTVQGLLSSIWYGIGSAIGSIVGGILYQSVGPRAMFGLSSVWCLICGCAFAVSQFVIERRTNTERTQAEENIFVEDDEHETVEFDQRKVQLRYSASHSQDASRIDSVPGVGGECPQNMITKVVVTEDTAAAAAADTTTASHYVHSEPSVLLTHQE